MRSHALSALSLVELATSSAAADQLHIRQQTACLNNIVSLAEATPTIPAALEVVTGDCIPNTLSEIAASFTSEAAAWYTSLVDAASNCPAWPATASPISMLSIPELPVCTGEQASRDATATLTSASSNAVATNTDPTRPSTMSASTAATTSAPRSSAASGSATRSATTTSSQSTNAAARETGAIFVAVAMAALVAAAL